MLTLTMEAWRLKMEQWRIFISVLVDSHDLDEQYTDPQH